MNGPFQVLKTIVAVALWYVVIYVDRGFKVGFLLTIAISILSSKFKNYFVENKNSFYKNTN